VNRKTTLSPLAATAVLEHWKVNGNQDLVATVERTLAMARMGGDPRIDAALILQAIGDVYGVPGAAPGKPTPGPASSQAARPKPNAGGKMVRRRGSAKSLTGHVMNAVSMWLVARMGRK
jgi:hypothetical protein